MEAMPSLLNPNAIAVVGASQRQGRGTRILSNGQTAESKGGINPANPRDAAVRGCRCYRPVRSLPAAVDCIAVAVAADAACEVLEQAYAHGIRAAVVMS